MTKEIKQRIDQIKNGEVPRGYKKTKIGIVPNGWEENLIGDYFERVSRPIVKPTEKYWRLGLRSHAKGTFYELVESPEKVTMDELYIVRENDFLLNITFAWEHAVAVANKQDDGKLVSHRFPTYIATNKCDINYWKHYSSRRNFKLQLELISHGGAGRNRVMNQSLFLKLPATLPQLNEQQKIAGILSTQDKVIELKEKLLKEKEKRKRYLVQNLVTGRKRLKGFNEEWGKVKLGELCEIKTGKLDANAMVDNGKYPFFTCAKQNYFIDDYAFDTEAILISGNGANVGYVHYYKGKFNAYQRTYVLDNFTQEVFYLKHFLDNNLSVRIDREKNQGNTPYIVLSTLTQMKILLPPLEEQKAIAEILTTADKELKLLQEELEEEKQRKKALMQLLLTGIVRVKV